MRLRRQGKEGAGATLKTGGLTLRCFRIPTSIPDTTTPKTSLALFDVRKGKPSSELPTGCYKAWKDYASTLISGRGTVSVY